MAYDSAAQSLSEISNAIELQAEDAEKGIAELSERVDFVASRQGAARDKIQLLSEKSVLIGGITDSIIEIAKETNLLTLNGLRGFLIALRTFHAVDKAKAL